MLIHIIYSKKRKQHLAGKKVSHYRHKDNLTFNNCTNAIETTITHCSECFVQNTFLIKLTFGFVFKQTKSFCQDNMIGWLDIARKREVAPPGKGTNGSSKV